VVEHRAQLGIAHDGDADRVLLCDEHGTLIDGDDILAMTALDLLAQGNLAERLVVATVMSNAGLDAAIQQAGGGLLRTDVGDKHVIDEMLRSGARLGGEQSGHIIFRDHATTGDGLIAALQVLRLMKARNALLSQLVLCWRRFPQRLINIPVIRRAPFEELDGVLALVDEAQSVVQPAGGRVFLRYSGTEPKARLLLEGPEADVLEHWGSRIAETIRLQIGSGP
jgi:phosphoglucosamine mutase